MVVERFTNLNETQVISRIIKSLNILTIPININLMMNLQNMINLIHVKPLDGNKI